MGLSDEAQKLVILIFAAQTDRSFYLHGSPVEVNLSNVTDHHELRTTTLPPADGWDVAVQRRRASWAWLCRGC